MRDTPDIAARVEVTAPYQADPPFEGGADGTIPELDVDEDDPCTALFLEVPDPGDSAASNTFRFTGGDPTSRVFLVAGLHAGSTPLPRCGGVALSIADPREGALRWALPDASGRGEITLQVPAAASGRTVLFQLAQLPSCRVSNLVVQTFP